MNEGESGNYLMFHSSRQEVPSMGLVKQTNGRQKKAQKAPSRPTPRGEVNSIPYDMRCRCVFHFLLAPLTVSDYSIIHNSALSALIFHVFPLKLTPLLRRIINKTPRLGAMCASMRGKATAVSKNYYLPLPSLMAAKPNIVGNCGLVLSRRRP